MKKKKHARRRANERLDSKGKATEGGMTKNGGEGETRTCKGARKKKKKDRWKALDRIREGERRRKRVCLFHSSVFSSISSSPRTAH
jgi:hypothetical protein